MTQANGRRDAASAAPKSERPRRFGSTEHLASEAIAAFVDGELRMNAHLRAAQHMAQCPECAAEVDAQQQARRALRRSGELSVPATLLGALRQIPSADFPNCHRDRGGSVPAESRRWTLPWRK